MIAYYITDELALIWDTDYYDDTVSFLLRDMKEIIENYGYRRLRGKRKMSGSPGSLTKGNTK